MTATHDTRAAGADNLDALVFPDRIHRRLFTDPLIFELEMSKIFAGVWVYLTHESLIPDEDDFVTTTNMGGRPVIAGAVIAGKTVSTELAFLRPALTRNPHNLDHTPGGSSSGSAAAVADCMVPLALGSQTAGSLIRPAAYCGVVGYVGTHGELPLRGVQALSPCFDALGVLCRRVEDVQLARAALLDASLR